MSNILVLGVGPLPVDNAARLHAPGMRTWQIAKLLADRSHEVCVGLINFGDFSSRSLEKNTAHMEEAGPNIRLYHLSYDEENSPAALATLHNHLNFECCISTTDIMNSVAADIPLHLPLWLDYNGDPFAEKQLQGNVHENDDTLLKQWRMYFKGLASGDRFSTATQPQKHALIGQLGFSGRLNEFTCGEEMVHSMPNCSRAIRDMGLPRNFQVKSAYIPSESFMILWSGGYNTWCDPEILFYAMERAMRENPSIYFVSTGGAIEGHDTISFKKFEDLALASDLAVRFRFLGWRDSEEIPAFYRQADAAIVTDRFSYEGELGARTRLNDWLDFGIPVICTEQCELTRELVERNLVHSHKVGDVDGLVAAILKVAAGGPEIKNQTKAAQAYFDDAYAQDRVFAPMLAWAEEPRFAGDRCDKTMNSGASIGSHTDSQLTRLLGEMLTKPHKSAASKSVLHRAWKRLKGRA